MSSRRGFPFEAYVGVLIGIRLVIIDRGVSKGSHFVSLVRRTRALLIGSGRVPIARRSRDIFTAIQDTRSVSHPTQPTMRLPCCPSVLPVALRSIQNRLMSCSSFTT
jgi:hypothetical protein